MADTLRRTCLFEIVRIVNDPAAFFNLASNAKAYLARFPFPDPSFDLAVQVIPGTSVDRGGANSPGLYEEFFDIAVWRRRERDWGVRDDDLESQIFDLADTYYQGNSGLLWDIIGNNFVLFRALGGIQHLSSSDIRDAAVGADQYAYQLSSWSFLWTGLQTPTAPHT